MLACSRELILAASIFTDRCPAEANEDNKTNCNNHADHLAGSHRLRIVSN